MNTERAPTDADDDSEAVQVLTIRGNRIYLSHDVREAFNLHDGDKIVVYSDSGKMTIKIIRKPRTSHQVDLTGRTG